MSTLPQKFYPVVDHAQWVKRLGAAGARFIQLRLKDLPGEELRAQVRQARTYAAEHDVCLVLNDFWQLALDEGISYIHLGQEDLDTADMPAIRKAGLRVGISTHCPEELERALGLTPDYVALGPIWETRLKKMAFGPQGVEKLREWKQRIGTMPLVAIGGITLERAPSCLAAGADCVSAVSAFTQHADPEGQVRAWLEATTGV
ncbi:MULTISPECIES: thiamine phosphate synthase [Acetobacter]|jgi:thiamine-phosphate pyrophosphorylase|uniref:Thiamine-phosphate pyrophosphorylase n=1 Tax=Acetobacter lovaniensis TaxID=104100 RepID=A0A841QB24_9PROT|nr:thiamine phosphate synthase [Acetobacter lovaniensis]MBB6455630.1 thiamine-phosphate pyrophosphorylase [Acetobacter lovaniensis]MCI1697436.1 thiamine phosphate synthase [Acetobacter lovaniensis]MCI1796320.1 thiamine phosphate synthase [Acetobacter lovaniensis]MCP1238535.1 thiamine phosphate synthase [Acetobacter lovaniensis]NHN80029.1 thiamine phosphate synthase [Acetobacter lovaniensis]